MRCSSCGHGNTAGAGFCTSCGAQLAEAGASGKERGKSHKKARPGNGTKRQAPHRYGLIAVAGIAAVAALLLIMRRDAPSAPPTEFGAGLPVVFDDPVRQIAAKFWCACGSCDVPELADCTCPTAVKQKRLIEQELDKGTAQADIIRIVERRFSSIKPRYASLARAEAGAPRAGGAETNAAAAGTAAPALDAARELPGPRLASLADTTAVASRFSCACGQCGELPLAECSCEHPRGAAEIKAFIVYKIQQGRTVDEVVQAVAYEYGHLLDAGKSGS